MYILEQIKGLCLLHNITVTKLEEICGLSQNSIKKWETSTPRSDALAKIADYFNVSVDYLLGRTTDPEQKEKPTGEPMGYKRFSESLKEKGLTEIDIENLSKEQLSTIADIVKNFKQ